MDTFNIKDNVVVFGVDIIGGYAEDSAIEVEQDNDDFDLKVGCDGEPARSVINNSSGKVTVHLGQWSKSNAILSAARRTDKLAGATRQLIVKNKRTGVVEFFAAEAWVQKVPKRDRGKMLTNHDWVFVAGESDGDIGGIE